MGVIFDESRDCVITPANFVKKIKDVPKFTITCFSKVLFYRLLKMYPHKLLSRQVGSANGRISYYAIYYKDIEIGFYMSPVGAPQCVGMYEEFLELGVENLIMFGSCGVLDKNIKDCSIILPLSSFRDEGTSQHYVNDSEEIESNMAFVAGFEKYLQKLDIKYSKGKNWTTDSAYRETKNKVNYFKNKGAISVDMEASAMAAVSKYHNTKILQLFYAADNLDAEKWDKRSLVKHAKVDKKTKIFDLLFEFVYQLIKKGE